MKKLLFGPKDAQSGEIARAFSECGRREIVAAAFAVAEKYVKLYELAEERNGDGRVRVALGTAKLWAKGVVKMPYGKAKILDAHAAARAAYSPVATAAARAVAQAASAVHSPRHVMGAVYYGLTAVALAKGGDVNCEEVEAEKARILQTIDRIKADPPPPDGWADFLLTKEERADRAASAKRKAEIPQEWLRQTSAAPAAGSGSKRKRGGKSSDDKAVVAPERIEPPVSVSARGDETGESDENRNGMPASEENGKNAPDGA